MNLMWESVRMGVCRKCIDGNGKGDCRLPSDELCPLETYFPIVTDMIVTAGSPGGSMSALRTRVCGQCLYGSPIACRKRDTLDCALERHMPVVIERILGFRSG
jgi:hypothetical protein